MGRKRSECPDPQARGQVSQMSVNSLAFSGTGALATADENNVRLWEAAGSQLKQIAKVSGHTRTIRSVYFDGDGKRMISGGDGQEVLLWTPQPRRRATYRYEPLCARSRP